MTSRPMRIAPQPPTEWNQETKAEFDAVVSVGAKRRPVHLPAVIAHHPTYLSPYLTWAKAISLQGVLSTRDNALLALRVALLCRSEFEWGVHAETAPARAGLDDADLWAIGEGPDSSHWTDIERHLLTAADELHRDHGVSDPTWAGLAEHYEQAALLEIVFVVGHYTMLSMVANAAGVAPEPNWRALPDL